MAAHEAGALHSSDYGGVASVPAWLRPPSDVNELLPALWSATVRRGGEGVLEVGGIDVATLAERLDMLRLEMRSLGFEPEVSTFQLADAWHSVVPGSNPAPIAERNLDSASLAASLLHVAGDLYEPSGHLYGRARTTGAPGSPAL